MNHTIAVQTTVRLFVQSTKINCDLYYGRLRIITINLQLSTIDHTNYRFQSCTIVRRIIYNRTDQSQNCTKLTVRPFKIVIIVHRRYIVDNS